MNPALLVVVVLAGSGLLVGGVLGAVLGWLPLVPGIALAAAGGLVETVAVLLLVRGRRPRAARD